MQHKKFLQKDENYFVSWEIQEYEMSWEPKLHILGELTIFDGDKIVYFSHNSVEAIKALIPELQAFVKEFETVAKKQQPKKKVAAIKAKK